MTKTARHVTKSRAATAAAAVVSRADRHGIVIPRVAFSQAKATGLPFPLACAILMRETAGGHNVFGHDPTVAIGWGKVTKAKYEAYKRLRDAHGHGSRAQGVGPCQLTYVGFQDAADRAGGCWKTGSNCHIGFKTLEANIRRHGLWSGVRAYNGSGSAASAYANAVIYSFHWWQLILSGASVRKAAIELDGFEPKKLKLEEILG